MNYSMSRLIIFLFSAATMGIASVASSQPVNNLDALNDLYAFGPDSALRDGVPRGEVKGPFVIPSDVYPGTQHTYWVYVPAQYNPNEPAALMVYNDGAGYLDPDGKIRSVAVMDNLIYRREIPVMIAVFINPGRRPDQPEATSEDWGDRFTNRPEEYNSIDDRYARVICDELLPAIKAEYNISDDPAMRGIAGSSSGGIAAFGVAWHRPDQFGKVISMIGTFVNLGGRGGHTFSDQVLANAPKPVRVFLFDGRNDNRNSDEQRDWFSNNVKLKDALVKQDYDVNWVWSINPHSSWSGGTMYPSFMRWTWRDHGVDPDPANVIERSPSSPW